MTTRTQPAKHPDGCKHFRSMNDCKLSTEQLQAIWREMNEAGSFLGRSLQNVSYYSHTPDGSTVTDYYCRMSWTQMQWMGTDASQLPDRYEDT